MKTIASIFAAAVLLLSTLTACGTGTMSKTDEARVTPDTTVTETARPSATSSPNGPGDTVGDAARSAGNAVGNAVEDAGDAVGDAAKGAGSAVSDLFDGDNEAKTGAGLEDDRN